MAGLEIIIGCWCRSTWRVDKLKRVGNIYIYIQVWKYHALHGVKENEYSFYLSHQRQTCINLFIITLVKFTFSFSPLVFRTKNQISEYRSEYPRPVDNKDKRDWIGRRGFNGILFFFSRERRKEKTNEIDDYGRVVKRNVVNEERRKNGAV